MQIEISIFQNNPFYSSQPPPVRIEIIILTNFTCFYKIFTIKMKDFVDSAYLQYLKILLNMVTLLVCYCSLVTVYDWSKTLTFIVDCFCALVDVRIFLFLPRPPLALAGGWGLSEQGHFWFPSALLWWRIHSCLTRTLLHRLSGETQTRLDIEVCALYCTVKANLTPS